MPKAGGNPFKSVLLSSSNHHDENDQSKDSRTAGLGGESSSAGNGGTKDSSGTWGENENEQEVFSWFDMENGKPVRKLSSDESSVVQCVLTPNEGEEDHGSILEVGGPQHRPTPRRAPLRLRRRRSSSTDDESLLSGSSTHSVDDSSPISLAMIETEEEEESPQNNNDIAPSSVSSSKTDPSRTSKNSAKSTSSMAVHKGFLV